MVKFRSILVLAATGVLVVQLFGCDSGKQQRTESQSGAPSGTIDTTRRDTSGSKIDSLMKDTTKVDTTKQKLGSAANKAKGEAGKAKSKVDTLIRKK